MEQENRSILARLNPGNLNFTNKVVFMVLLIVLAVIVIYFSVGLSTLKRSLIKNTGELIEELNYSKGAEIELNLKRVRSIMFELSGQEHMRRAGTELSEGFAALRDDKYEMFSEEKQNEIRAGLEQYYNDKVAEHLPLSGEEISNYIPLEPSSLVSQYIYLEQNPKPYGEKHTFYGELDFSSYSRTHASYHPLFLELLKKLDAKDLYVIDPETGYVVYSVMKNIDFGINLFEGKFRNSPLAVSFLKALASDQETISTTDFSRYIPGGDGPACFFSIPIYIFNEQVYVLVVQFDNKLIDNALYDESIPVGFSSLEYNLVGDDLLIRNDPAAFLNDPETFTQDLLKRSGRTTRKDIIKHAKSGSFSFFLKYPASSKNQILGEDIIEIKDYAGRKVLACSRRLGFNGVDLYLITKMDQKELLAPFTKQIFLYILIGLGILGLAYLVLYTFGKSFTSRLNSLLNALDLLHNGEKSQKIAVGVNDEVGATIQAYNKLRKRITNAEEFAIEMSEGNYNYSFDVLSDRDSLGKSLNGLKDTLIKSKEEQEIRAREDEIQNWINAGIAKFNDLLRVNNNNIELLAYSIIENMIEYLDAQIGGIFLVEGDIEESKTIDLIASYAYDRRKYMQKSQAARDGLLGACYMEKKPIHLKEIPEDYVEIVSGLGHEVPKCLYIVPLKVDENVLGMIEVGSFSDFFPHQIELMDKVADSIAATFISVRLNMKTATLLEESNSRAEEIAQQEEEMRQNLEEMQATQEELARLRQDDEKRTNEMQLIVENTRATLKNLLESIPGGYSLKDQNGIIHLINSEGAEYYGLSLDRVSGKTDHELLPAKIYEKEHKHDLLTIDEGEQRYTEKVDVKGTKHEFNVIKKPFMMSEIGQQGILTIRMKVK